MFQTIIRKSSNQWRDWINSATTKEELNTSITKMWNKLDEAGKECFPPFLPKAKYAPWWSPNLKALRKHVNALKRGVQRCKNQTLKEFYTARFKALKTHYKGEILKAKQESWRNFCTESSKKNTLENVQGQQNWLYKAACPFLAYPPGWIHNHNRKGNGKRPPQQIFPGRPP